MTKTTIQDKAISYFISTRTDKLKDLPKNSDKPNFGGYDIDLDDNNIILPVNYVVKYKAKRVTKYYATPTDLTEDTSLTEDTTIFTENEVVDEEWVENIIVSVNVFSFYDDEKEALNLSKTFMKKHFLLDDDSPTISKKIKFDFLSIEAI